MHINHWPYDTDTPVADSAERWLRGLGIHPMPSLQPIRIREVGRRTAPPRQPEDVLYVLLAMLALLTVGLFSAVRALASEAWTRLRARR